jgi:beta-amylase
MQPHTDRLMAVMAPLKLRDDEFSEFARHLKEARDIGVEAITVDLWWGLVMRDPQRPDWDYYDRVFAEIEKVGLAIVPIMSFHRCGGGPGDDVDIRMPPWLSDLVSEAGRDPGDLRYLSETGRESSDHIPPWVGEEVPDLYDAMARYIEAFLAQYGSWQRANPFPEINVSLGPTGELRYPSYSAADGWQFPHRGFFQCYSESARRSFLRWVRDPANGCSWAEAFRDDEIRVPEGQLPPGCGARADAFVAQRLHLQPGYGRDFATWYHRSLVDHGKRIVQAAIRIIRKHYASTSPDFPVPMVGIKIPGIHWQWRCTGVPRFAELTAGLIPPETCAVPDPSGATGYESFFDMVAETSAAEDWPIRVHFTALEMDDDAVDCSWANDAEKTSMAFSLVNAVGRTAASRSVMLAGENALSFIAAPDSPYDVRNWAYVRKAFDTGHFSGFTMLRLGRGAWDADKGSLREFIERYDIDPVAKRVAAKHA